MVTGEGHGGARSVVLVHGLWSGPYDWSRVIPLLERADVAVSAVDLPSHCSPAAGAREDGEAVRASIRACEPPVVVAGWSYGGDAMSLGAEDETGVARLVYVASYPSPPQSEFAAREDWIDDDPLIRRVGDDTYVLDTDLWLGAESHLFDVTLLAHLKEHRRRPVSLRVARNPIVGTAWMNIPFTVVLGRSDSLVPLEEAVQKITALTAGVVHSRPDIRIIDCDHFMPLRTPEAVADVILESTS